ncbi:hypothetical protein FRX31_028456 [Thalictrum thalictroides]|uniref:Uncharacterized protein n=1 Tax=Thalictrum thalictroides TaxID=46969 RepID=A0A7J6VA40_THATH|nr:hypothetical protein FRX31_028456 [Thalictrum thalictroides]
MDPTTRKTRCIKKKAKGGRQAGPFLVQSVNWALKEKFFPTDFRSLSSILLLLGPASPFLPKGWDSIRTY